MSTIISQKQNEKLCTSCLNLKNLENFHNNKKSKDGKCKICKLCARKKTNTWRLKNIEKDRKNSLDYYEKNKNKPEFIKKRGIYSKEYRKKNNKQRTEYNKEYRKENREKYNLWEKQYYEKNREKHSMKSKNWRETNGKYKMLHLHAKSRAKNKNIQYELSPEIIKSLVEKQGGKCFFTGIPFSDHSEYKIRPFTASIDRLDNNKGYILDNVRMVCTMVNKAKNIYDLSLFDEMCISRVRMLNGS